MNICLFEEQLLRPSRSIFTTIMEFSLGVIFHTLHCVIQTEGLARKMQNCWVLSKTCDLICVLMCYLGIYLGLCPPGEGASKVGQEQFIVQIRKQ